MAPVTFGLKTDQVFPHALAIEVMARRVRLHQAVKTNFGFRMHSFRNKGGNEVVDCAQPLVPSLVFVSIGIVDAFIGHDKVKV